MHIFVRNEKWSMHFTFSLITKLYEEFFFQLRFEEIRHKKAIRTSTVQKKFKKLYTYFSVHYIKSFCNITVINFSKEIKPFWEFIKAIRVWPKMPVKLEAFTWWLASLATCQCHIVKLTPTNFLLHNSLVVPCSHLWSFSGPLWCVPHPFKVTHNNEKPPRRRRYSIAGRDAGTAAC